MSIKEYIRKTLMEYFIIVTGITVAIAVLGTNYDREATFGYEAYFSPLIFGAIAVLPSLVMYSGRELTLRQMLFRRVLHFVLLEAALLSFGFLSGLFQDNNAAVPFALSVFVVYLFTNIIRWMIDSRTADEINEGLKRIRQSEDSKQ